MATTNAILPRYFVDYTNPDDPKVYVYTLLNGKMGFYDSVSGAEIPESYIASHTTEKTIEQLPQNRLVPFVFPYISSDSEFVDNFKRYLLSPLFITNRFYTTSDILEIINENFGKHISFTFFNDKVKLMRFNKSSIEKTVQEGLLDSIPLTNELFRVINFLRSYVDLYHDILEKGNKYCEQLAIHFRKTIDNRELRDEYDRFMNLVIDKKSKFRIKTDSGKINQTRCKQFVEYLTDEFIDILVNDYKVSFMPRRKESASIMSASIDNIEEMKKLITTLKQDGIDMFYVESANNKIGEILVNQDFKLCDLSIGKWDAGSGYSGKGITPIMIGPKGAIDVPNQSIDMFGLIRTDVQPDNKKLICSQVGGNSKTTLEIPGPVKLSVNSIMTTIGEGIVRGSEEAEIKTLATIPQVNSSSSPFLKQSLVSLKTWTDLIQIVTISKTQALKMNVKPVKILTVIYDGLCETTARMFGLGPVLKTEGNIITYYNYNLTSRQLTSEEIEVKTKLRDFISEDVKPLNEYYKKKYKFNIGESKNDPGSTPPDTIFGLYVSYWFNQRIETLKAINEVFFDPVIFFVTKLFIQKYVDAQKKSISLLLNIQTTDIKLMPNTIDDYIESITSSASLLGGFFDYISKFNIAIKKIEELGSRADINTFLDAYDYVQQQIVNTFGNSSVLELRAMVATTFAFVFLKQYNYVRFFTNLNIIKEYILTKYVTGDFKAIKMAVPEYQVKLNTYGRMLNSNSLVTSLTKIKEPSIDIPDTVRNRLLNIADIEIACQTLLTQSMIATNNQGDILMNNENVVNYQHYIKTIPDRPFIQIQSQWAFSKIVKSVEDAIKGYINTGTYLGGRIKRKKYFKTRKQVRNKRRTAKVKR